MRIVLKEEGVEYTAAKKVRTPADVQRECAELVNQEQEAFTVILLNSKNNMISADVVTVGLLDASLVHPREVFRQAIIKNAAAVILVHNHPSGDPAPSAEDIRITKQLVDAGKIIDIKVLDHVVLGRADDRQPGFVSMREQGLIDFN